MLDSVAKLLIAAGAANASPVGPDANVANFNINEWDPIKGWYGITWTNGDATAYIHLSEDGGTTVKYTLFPGTTSRNDEWTVSQVNNDVVVRATKNGTSLDWVGNA